MVSRPRGPFRGKFAQDMMCMRSGTEGDIFGYTSDWKILSLKNHGIVPSPKVVIWNIMIQQ